MVFFHGLGGDARTTWQATKKDQASFWPAWLGEDINSLSVYCVGYEAPLSDRDRATMHPTDLASNVLNGLLVDTRLGDGELILLGHSLGGLVIKLMLRKADAEKKCRAEAASFIDRVRKVAFLATPHSGADLARVADVLRVLVRPSAATMSLVRNDAYLRDLNEGYRDLARDRDINHLILTERRPLIIRRKVLGVTYFRKNLGVIVKPDSGDPGLVTNPIPIPADHIEIAKPANRDGDNIYKFVRDFVLRHAERPVSREEKKLVEVKEDTQAIRADVDRLIALLDKREIDKAAEAGLERETIFQLARRVQARGHRVQSSGQRIRERSQHSARRHRQRQARH